MGWFWADKRDKNLLKNTDLVVEAKCPMVGSTAAPSEVTAACPVMHGSGSESRINPLNNMPQSISHKRQQDQKLDLPKDRTVSSIPKGNPNAEEFWEYPSPQQMYNAMVRKGKIDPNTGEEIPEDAVESMVFVHNFLNEGCWQEVMEWESKYTKETHMEPKLMQFMGKPSELSPRARWFHFLGTILPSHFSSELPFDRHDWVVLRPDPTSADPETPGYRKVRYVIDFYSGADDEDGLPTFNLDVRPALDSFSNAKDRFAHWTKPIFDEYFNNDKK